MTTHADRAKRSLFDALGEADHLDEIPLEVANSYDARRMRRRVDDRFAAATVWALLALVDELRELDAAIRSGVAAS